MTVCRKSADGERILFWCPGCDGAHAPSIAGNGPHWSFNGDMDKPTFSPSILSTWDQYQGEAMPPIKHVCHSFVNDGKIQFLADCTHRLANQTVDLKDFDKW